MHVTDTALKAKRQNLYHTVRTLRAFNAAQTGKLERCRAEAAATKARHVQWEADLNNKLKAYREGRKARTTEALQSPWMVVKGANADVEVTFQGVETTDSKNLKKG
ncbi:conserved hypothetical protein [Sporisorium reilianum SRZ2]|uniref:Uncharacterized protein n=1 Tax=Sporisorium reilianum (strain SRZ2) TaxID=999809 RepID=E6ZYL1_SPORE|nr:conserved hypothetical protein [Sporisorium reilianum SRZ2]